MQSQAAPAAGARAVVARGRVACRSSFPVALRAAVPTASRPRHASDASRVRSLLPLRAATEGPAVPYPSSDMEELLEDDSEWCAPTFVTWENKEREDCTVLNVDSPDYPGLLRILAWAMNGMELRVQSASLNVTDDGFAENKFYVTSYGGKKLSDKYAASCAERLSEFAFYCKPSDQVEGKTEFTRGQVTVSNSSHDLYSTLTVRGEPDRDGFLLEICSVISGLGFSAKSGSINNCREPSADMDDPVCDADDDGRVFEILLYNKEKSKLDAEEANALLFVIGMLIDPTSHGSTIAPNVM